MDEIYPNSEDPLLQLPGQLAARYRNLIAVLEATPGVRLYDGYHGCLRVGNRSARLKIESEEWIGVRMPLDPKATGRYSIPSERELPGNLRLADVREKPVLFAETRVNGVAHLTDSIGELRHGLRRLTAAGPTYLPEPPEAPEPEVVATAVEAAREKLELDPTGAVALEDGSSFELHPRHEGPSIAVRITRERGGVRLAHQVSRTACAEAHRESLQAEARHWNARIRFARLVLATDGSLIVESRLRSALVTGEWIALATRAIAAVTREVQAPLRLLAADPRVSEAYAAVLPSRLEPELQRR